MPAPPSSPGTTRRRRSGIERRSGRRPRPRGPREGGREGCGTSISSRSVTPADGEGRWTLIYDGDCGFCRATVRWALDRDRRGLLRARPLQDADALAEAGIRRAEAERAAFLVAPDGRTWRGADAAARTLRLLPRWGGLGRFLELPGVRRLSRLAYRWIAEHRPLVSRLTGVGRQGG